MGRGAVSLNESMPKGVLNCSVEGRFFHRYYTSAPGTNTFNVGMMDIFTTLIAAFDSSMAQSYGIVRRASNYGLTGTGTNNISRFTQANIMTNPGFGFTRWDSGAVPGNNAWAVYEFTQAVKPFWMLVQFSKESIDFSYSRFGESPGNGSTQNINTSDNGKDFLGKNNAVAIAIGMMHDGSSPWNGTTNNNGADTKGSPTWKTDAVKFPRANDEGAWAQYDSSRTIPILHEISAIYSAGYGSTHQPPTAAITYDAFNLLYHVIFDQDNILIFFDANGTGSATSIFYFGRFKPYDSTNQIPYVCLFRNTAFDDSFPAISTAEDARSTYVAYGCVNSNSSVDLNTISAGYCAQPYITGRQPINGGVYHPARRHSGGCVIVLPPHMVTENLRQIPNMQLQQDSSGKFLYPTAYPDVMLMEYPNRYGYLGSLLFFKIAKNLRAGHFFSDRELIIGNSAMNTNKLIIPWDPSTDYGVFGNRYGTVWA